MTERREKAVELVQEFLQGGLEIPFSPVVGRQLIELSNKPIETIETKQLVRLLDTDAGFAGEILRLANSSYFAGVEKIVSLRRAIIQIGLEESINFMQMAYYRAVLPDIPPLEGYFSGQDYWTHSWATALAGKILGHPRAGGRVLPGELYIAGLLHGIGRVVLAFNRPVDLAKVLKKSQDLHLPFTDVQLELFGTTDADIACELLTLWQLPEHICQAIRYMYCPQEAPADFQEFSGLLQLACCITGAAGMDQAGWVGVEQSWVVTESELALANPALLNEFITDIQRVLERKGQLLVEENENENPEPDQEDMPEKAATPDSSSRSSDSSGGIVLRFFQWLRSLFF